MRDAERAEAAKEESEVRVCSGARRTDSQLRARVSRTSEGNIKGVITHDDPPYKHCK